MGYLGNGVDSLVQTKPILRDARYGPPPWVCAGRLYKQTQFRRVAAGLAVQTNPICPRRIGRRGCGWSLLCQTNPIWGHAAAIREPIMRNKAKLGRTGACGKGQPISLASRGSGERNVPNKPNPPIADCGFRTTLRQDARCGPLGQGLVAQTNPIPAPYADPEIGVPMRANCAKRSQSGPASRKAGVPAGRNVRNETNFGERIGRGPIMPNKAKLGMTGVCGKGRSSRAGRLRGKRNVPNEPNSRAAGRSQCRGPRSVYA
jgi:hypothetical protein